MTDSTRSARIVCRKVPLAEQVADILRSSIYRGDWLECLPSERDLSRTVSVSRPTLRRALHLLREEGIIRIHPSQGACVLERHRRKRSLVPRACVAFLCAPPWSLYGDTKVLLVDELREALHNRGHGMEVIVEPRLNRCNQRPVLLELIRRHHASHWLLASVPPAVQDWFQQEQIPAIVVGYPSENNRLPAIYPDLRVIARHATGVLRALGHRQIVCLCRRAPVVGYAAIKQGFIEAMRATQGAADGFISCDDEVPRVRAALDGILSRTPRVTAMVIAHAMNVAPVMTLLLGRGRRVPGEISLITLQSERFLERIVPEPARYVLAPGKMAKGILRLLVNPNHAGGRIRLLSALSRGETLAPPVSVS